MKVVVTGAAGFLGWHTRCALLSRHEAKVVSVDRAEWNSPDTLDAAVIDADAVLHLAGVNRADADALRGENALLAQMLTSALDRTGSRPKIVYANSIQAGNGTPFGDGKQAAADHLMHWSAKNGVPMSDVRLPNLFGEHGRPGYNSVVATFCDKLAGGETPVIHEDRELPLVHVQDAVSRLIELIALDTSSVVRLDARPTTVSGLLRTLEEFRDLYANGDIPDIADPLRLALFNTYRSFTFPDPFPLKLPLRADRRGHLFECVRSHGGQGQVFCSTTGPGSTRGQHFHLRKIERFVVITGSAEIALRRLFSDQIVRFRVSGSEPAIVDMPTMWAHSITNVGDDDLMTLFWAHEVLDPTNPDTYPERVDLASMDGNR